MTPPHHTVTVAGSGPAAWAVTAELIGRGVDVLLVSPAPDEPWKPTYGCWADDLVRAGLHDPSFGRRFDRVAVTGHRRHRLDRPYVVIDNEAVRSELRRRAADGGAPIDVRAATVSRIRGTGRSIDVTLGDGTVVTTRAVIDATGAEPAILAGPPTRRTLPVQAAYGVVARFDRPPASPGEFTMMDWSPVRGAAPQDPSFLYAFELGDGWWLAEETSLARSPSLSQGELRRRLTTRLAAAGAAVGERRAVEEVAIPMGVPVPAAQLAMGFGAAGGLVHPATGYSVGASLATAPLLAEVIATEREMGATPAALAAAGWSALWPSDRRRARALHEYGLDVLLRLDAPSTATFFDAFFELPPDLWSAYLDPRVELGRLVDVMQTMFGAVPWRLRATLATGDPRRLLSAFLRRS